MQNYDAEYKKLNPAQRIAVDTIDGPVLVVAGPGTGKTQLLSMRVASILKKTDTDPYAILCLTFTNKAASNMRERLVPLIGPEAHRIQVKTFHSFAADIMRENPDHFWNGAPLTSAPDAVSLGIIQDILSELPLDNPLALRFSGMYTATSDVQQGLKLAKEAGLTPAKLRSLITANIAYIDVIEPLLADILAPALSIKKLGNLVEQISQLPKQNIDQLITPLLSLDSVLRESLEFAVTKDEALGRTTNTGAWKRRWLQTVDGKKGMFDERKRNDWWLKLADVYERYRSRLNQRGYYDYADMLVEVISQLESEADLRASVQEQFLFVMIDEFQDTNAAQLRLAHLVADQASGTDAPNLMAVGDDDQSIFKFNGADLNNMLSFRRSYPSAKVIVLTNNYRSSQQVLNAAQSVIEQAADRLVNRDSSLNKTLKAVNPPAQPGQIQHQIYPTREHQYTLLAEEINRRHTQNPEMTIAVLARSHTSLRAVAAALVSQNVPVRYEQQQNILDHEASRQALLMAGAIDAISVGNMDSTNHFLAELIKHPMWHLEARVLWELAVSNFGRPAWLTSLRQHTDKNLVNIARFLEWLVQEASYQPLPVMMEYILGLLPAEFMSSPLKQYFLDNQPTSNSYLQTLSAVHRLRGLVNEFSHKPQASVSDFVEFVRLNQQNHKVITDESWFVSGDNAVDLLTVHKAKGLEFDMVYIIDSVEPVWQPRKSGRKPPANLPLQPYGDDYDDYVRLMYVAITRAKHSVFVTSFATDEAGETVLPTPLIQAIPSSSLALISSGTTIHALEQSISWPRLESVDEKRLLRGRLEDYQLSVTHLLNFLDVTSGGPKYFFERNLLRLPQAKSASLAYGSAAHHALEMAQKMVNNGNFNLSGVMSAYEQSLLAQHMPVNDYQRYLSHGQNVLDKLFNELNYILPAGSLPEQAFKNVTVGNARLSGALDRIDVSPDGLIIVDYKTGKPLNSFTTQNKNTMVKAWKHRTQLIFYTLLLRGSPRFSSSKNITGQMVYIEAPNRGASIRDYQASQEDLEQLSQLIQAVWQHIKDLSFPDTGHYPAGMRGIQGFINDLLNNKL